MNLVRVSNAEILIFVNAPIPQQHMGIAKTFDVRLIEFDLSTLDSRMRKFHPSTLRWPLIYAYFNVMIRNQCNVKRK